MNNLIRLKNLDHVAIRVRDMEKSVKWYKEVLGLRDYRPKEWGGIPIFMLAGKTGIALFPADKNGKKKYVDSKEVGIEHFAFNVENLTDVMDLLNAKEIAYNFQDHHYFHSIYLRDPDNHVVELTSLVVEKEEFYGDSLSK